MQTAIYQRAQSFVARRHADAGMTPRADGHAVYRVLLAAIRGLALEGVFMNSEEDVDSALGILTDSFTLLNPSLPRPPERYSHAPFRHHVGPVQIGKPPCRAS